MFGVDTLQVMANPWRPGRGYGYRPSYGSWTPSGSGFGRRNPRKKTVRRKKRSGRKQLYGAALKQHQKKVARSKRAHRKNPNKGNKKQMARRRVRRRRGRKNPVSTVKRRKRRGTGGKRRRARRAHRVHAPVKRRRRRGGSRRRGRRRARRNPGPVGPFMAGGAVAKRARRANKKARGVVGKAVSRSRAARKAAKTRALNAAKRSAAAKKAARTRKRGRKSTGRKHTTHRKRRRSGRRRPKGSWRGVSVKAARRARRGVRRGLRRVFSRRPGLKSRARRRKYSTKFAARYRASIRAHRRRKPGGKRRRSLRVARRRAARKYLGPRYRSAWASRRKGGLRRYRRAWGAVTRGRGRRNPFRRNPGLAGVQAAFEKLPLVGKALAVGLGLFATVKVGQAFSELLNVALRKLPLPASVMQYTAVAGGVLTPVLGIALLTLVGKKVSLPPAVNAVMAMAAGGLAFFAFQKLWNTFASPRLPAAVQPYLGGLGLMSASGPVTARYGQYAPVRGLGEYVQDFSQVPMGLIEAPAGMGRYISDPAGTDLGAVNYPMDVPDVPCTSMMPSWSPSAEDLYFSPEGGGSRFATQGMGLIEAPAGLGRYVKVGQMQGLGDGSYHCPHCGAAGHAPGGSGAFRCWACQQVVSGLGDGMTDAANPSVVGPMQRPGGIFCESVFGTVPNS